jgi:hypothetical protein
MTKRDFFRLIIKLFGLYSLIFSVFTILPRSISMMYGSVLSGILLITISITIIVAIYYFLIIKCDKVIDILKLDRGFDDDRIEFEKFNSKNIIKLAAIILGGFLLIKNIPLFLIGTFQAFKFHMSNSIDNQFITFTKQDSLNLTVGFINIIIGYFLLTNYRWISKLLYQKVSFQE